MKGKNQLLHTHNKLQILNHKNYSLFEFISDNFRCYYTYIDEITNIFL